MQKEKKSGLFRFGLAAIAALSLILAACPQEADTTTTVSDNADWDLPGGATPSVTAGSRKLMLSWDEVPGADRYQIYYGKTDNPYAATSAGYTIETRFAIPSLENGAKYNVWIRAARYSLDYDTLTYGPFGGAASGTPVAATATPAAPGDVRATPGQDYVKLTWAEVPAAETYTIERQEDGGAWTAVDGTIRFSPYFDKTLKISTTYKYRIKAANTFGDGNWSSEVTATTLAPYPLTLNAWNNRELKFSENQDILAAGTNYTNAHYFQISVPANTQYNVQWNGSAYGDGTKTADISASAEWKDTNTSIFTSTNNGWTTLRTLNNTTGSARVAMVKVGTYSTNYKYIGTYTIRCYDPNTTISQTPPSVFSATYWPGGIELSWNKIANVDGYNVYRATSFKGPFTKINGAPVAQPIPSTVTYANTGVTAGTTYYYQVSAVTTSPAAEGPRSAPYAFSIPGSAATTVALAPNTWANGNITVSSTVDWYTINAVNGTTYYVWWNDGYAGGGDGTKTLDIDVSACYADGSSIFSNIDAAWSSPESFTASKSGTVYLRARAYNGGAGTGTYGIVYNTTGTKP